MQTEGQKEAKVFVASSGDLSLLFDDSPSAPMTGSVESLSIALLACFERFRGRLIDCCVSETGLNQSDAEESIDGCIAYLRHFRTSAQVTQTLTSLSDRRLEVRTAPWGTIVAVLPKNAFLYLGLVCLTHALSAGNRVVLRVPSGCFGSADFLVRALEEAGEWAAHVTVVEAPATDLLDAFYASHAPGLVHYFGGSGRIPDLMSAAFKAGKGCIADGEGNTWVYVDAGTDPWMATDVLVNGSTRYGGQTCTSVNGAVVHADLLEQVAEMVVSRFGLQEVGRLGDPESARVCLETLLSAGGNVIAGGHRSGATVAPTLVLRPDESSVLVREGLFGPGLWMTPGVENDFRRLWSKNRYPLCACVLGPNVDVASWAALPNLARLVVNGDPSLEDPLEPWGGYPCSGNSAVSGWSEKYRRTVQIDRPSR
jgi:acyl-CoA reductase-like NAD-dependent aldehyde dehydrogenase